MSAHGTSDSAIQLSGNGVVVDKKAAVKFSKGSRRSAARTFTSNRGPTVPPARDYTPTRSTNKPKFYAEIEAASQFEQDSPEFQAFVRDVVNMPLEMAPSIAAAIRHLTQRLRS